MAHIDLACACGSENFERIVVQRPGQADYRTDFVACVFCRVMFHMPISGADATLERDAAIAARFYKKSGRR